MIAVLSILASVAAGTGTAVVSNVNDVGDQNDSLLHVEQEITNLKVAVAVDRKEIEMLRAQLEYERDKKNAN